jgi:transcriptional regulator with XRE-family HTH domain
MTPAAIGAEAPRMMLGRCLRGLREHAKLSIDTVAAGCEVSKATWSRVENGVTSVKSHDVERACRILGVTDAQLIHALTELAKQTKTKSWLSSYGEVVSDNFRHFISLEATANAISTYEPEFVPGLLQTPGYMRALMANDRFTGQELPSEEVVERRLEVRLKRQQILTQDSGATQFAAVVGESALWRLFGGAEAMIEQLVHLLRIGERDNVDLRVMPHDRDHAGLATGQFIMMEFPPIGTTFQLPPFVYVDGYLSYFLTDKPDETKMFKTAWPSLRDTALDPPESADLILSRLQELQQLR